MKERIMRKAPCKDCPDRFVGCHSVCVEYAKFKAQAEKIREEKNKEYVIQGYAVNSVRNMKQHRAKYKRSN